SGSLAFLGRVILARYADRINTRHASALVFLLAALGMTIIGLSESVPFIILGVLVFGFNVGNLTTLPALLVRREFGAPSFGKVFGITGTFMQIFSALGPATFGLLRDLPGGYSTPLFIAVALLVMSTLVITRGQWNKPFLMPQK